MQATWKGTSAGKNYRERIKEMIGDNEYGKKWLEQMEEKYGTDYAGFMGSSSSDSMTGLFYSPANTGNYNIAFPLSNITDEYSVPIVTTPGGKAYYQQLLPDILKMGLNGPKNWQLQLSFLMPTPAASWQYMPSDFAFFTGAGLYGYTICFDPLNYPATGMAGALGMYGLTNYICVDACGSIFINNNNVLTVLTWGNPSPISVLGVNRGYPPIEDIGFREENGKVEIRVGGATAPWIDCHAPTTFTSTTFRGLFGFYSAASSGWFTEKVYQHTIADI